MKRVAVILKFIRLSAFVSLLLIGISCNNSAKPSTASSTNVAAGTGPAAINGIAYIQADSIINNYDMYHDLKAELEKEVKQKESELKTKVTAFQKEASDFQEKYEKGLMTRSQAEELQQKLQRRQQELEETSSKMRMALAEKEAVMGRQIQDALLKYINNYNSDGKYALIISNAAILYGAPSMDITSVILAGMNKEYVSGKTE